MTTLRELMKSAPAVSEILKDQSLSARAAARQIQELTGVKKSGESIRLLRLQLGIQGDPHPTPHDSQPSEPQVGTGRATTDATGGQFEDVTLDAPIMDGNFDHVFKLFNLDPSLYQIVDETVKCSTWQQSKRLEDGQRDVVQLYSYSCRFRKTTAAALTEDDFQERRRRVHEWRPDAPRLARRTPGLGLGAPSTFVINWADWQLGKSEGGGVEATEQRVLDSFDRCDARVKELRAVGRNVEGIAVVNMGDPVEGCMGQYSSQLFTVELTQRRQLLMAMDLFETGIMHFATLAEKFDAVGVLCNHGEWNRVDSKQMTSDSDNASGFLMDAVQRVLKGHPSLAHIKWTIPQDEMIVQVDLSGVQNAFTHGHKIPSGTLKAEESWLASQSLNLLRRYGSEPRIWTTAHKHHAFLIDIGPYHRIQCSALDGGSKWYLDSSGKWSMPGTTTYLAGTHDVRGFSDYAIL